MSAEARKRLDQALAQLIPTPCRWHPSGVNALLLTPGERAVVIDRVERVLRDLDTVGDERSS